ncbi:transcriptional regulator with XRE-family HTH domain [Paenibacillus qinlingensis]|uniref:Transcriptional regulator with XRE-family HTH domain n=1 Tax=Paenibacillus qinlingensis TaxID=1837343 RepID=A0ABU1P6S7_9BACL|nr:transcriptional regulator with XRE-family HTH domain [Paenibacillus qinlingensis]
MTRSEITKSLEDRRVKLGLTKQELAYRCQIDISNISKITTHPKTKGYHVDTLISILDVLGMELTVKIKGDN